MDRITSTGFESCWEKRLQFDRVGVFCFDLGRFHVRMFFLAATAFSLFLFLGCGSGDPTNGVSDPRLKGSAGSNDDRLYRQLVGFYNYNNRRMEFYSGGTFVFIDDLPPGQLRFFGSGPKTYGQWTVFEGSLIFQNVSSTHWLLGSVLEGASYRIIDIDKSGVRVSCRSSGKTNTWSRVQY